MTLLSAVEEYLIDYRTFREAAPSFRRGFIDTLAKAIKKVDKAMARELAAGRLDISDIRRAEQAVGNCFELVREEFKSTYTEYTLKSAMLGRDRAIKNFNLGLDFKLLNEYARSKLTQHAFTASGKTLDRMTGDVMDTLIKAYRDGLSTYEIRQQLKQDFNDMERHELDRISRTELHNAGQAGAHLAYTEAGVEYEKWVTAMDDRVRGEPGGKWEEAESDHSQMHGQIVRTDVNFKHPAEGWEMLYPGDSSSAPISAWIQCRCQLVPFWMPQGKTVPEGLVRFYPDDLIEVAPEEGEFS